MTNEAKKNLPNKYEEWKKKHKETVSGIKHETTDSVRSSTLSGYDRYLAWKEKKQQETREAMSSRVGQYASDSNGFVSDARNRQKYGTDQYRTDSRDWLQEATERRDTLRQEAKDVGQQLLENRSGLDRESFLALADEIRNSRKNHNQVVKAASDEVEFYSQFGSAEDFDRYIEEQRKYAAQQERRKTLLNMNVEDSQTELDDLRSVRDRATFLQSELERMNSDPVLMIMQSDMITSYQSALADISRRYGSIDEMNAKVNQQQMDISEAKRLQNAQQLGNVSDQTDPYFWRTARQTPENADEQYRYINDVGYRREYQASMQRGIEGVPMRDIYGDAGLDMLTDEEKNIYNYYYNRDGREKAQEYLDGIQETLNSRKAMGIYENIEDNTFMEMLFGVEAGLDQFKSGISSLLNTEDDYIAQSAYQIASDMVRQDLEDVGPRILGNSLGQVGYDAITATANMAPSIITSMGMNIIAPGSGAVVGTAMMGASAAGNAYQEMLNMGYDKIQARAYSALVGGSEAGLQYLLGGVGKLGGKLSGNALTKLLNGVDNAFLRTALKLGGNMASEGLEEGLQEILTPWFQNLIMHTDEKVNWSEVAYSTLLGALTAGFMEGGSTVSGEVSTYKQGRELQEANVSAQRLAEIGKTFSADTVAYQLAGRVDENTGAYTMGRLFNEIGAEVTELNKADIQKSLERKGLSETLAKKNAEVFAEVVTGGKFTDTQMAIIEANEPLAKTVVDVIINPNSTVNQRSQGYNEVLMALAKEKTAPDVSRMNPAVPGQENAVSADAEGAVSESGSEALSEGEVSKAMSIASIQDGKATVKLEDGREVSVSEANLDPDDAVRIETIAGIDGISREDANFILATLRAAPGKISRFDALGAKEAYKYGRYGLSEDHITTHGVFANSLSESQRKAIYGAGRKASAAQTAAKQAAVAKNAPVAKNATTGKVHFDGDRSTLTERQSASLSVLEKVADALGVQIHVFDSQVDERGRRIGANGWYEGNEIHIDLHAGEHGEGVMLFTAAHELTHHIRKWSPEKFKTLADFLMEEYGKKDVNVDGLIREQMKKAERNGRSLSYDEAYEEVVADSMETMLSDGKVLEKLTKLKQKDESLWQKIKDFISELAAKIRAVYEGMTPDSVEGRYVAEMVDAIEKLQDLFVEGLVDASENYQAAEQMGIEIDADTESVSPAIAFSERTWKESDYVQEREKAAAEIAKAIGVSKKKAKAYIDSVNSIAKMIAEDRVRLDYFSSPGRSSFVGNVEYGGSFDFSTLCKKRRLLTGTFTAIQKALPNTALTADEILDIRNRMKEKGLEVSCGLCYVEGSRANMGQFAKEFLRLYKQYYPDAWQPNMADVNTPDGIEWVRINHPECYEQYEYFWNHYGTLKPGDKNLFASQQKPKLYQLHTEYKGEILRKFKDDDNVEEKNLNGGIRLQSFSDFEIVHLIDTMQIIMDMSRVGLAGQAYTKVPDFAWALGDTGLKINLSLIAKGVDENGKLIFDDVEGMPIDTAVALRNRYSKNVGTILVAFNDKQLQAAMADDRVDFIIPFHRSQWKKSQYEAMGLPAKTKDYTYMQNEKFIKPQYHEYRGRMVKDKATNYMPNEYWDFSKSGKENAVAYLEMCARNNKRPKFYKLLQNNGDGSYSLKADGSTDGYWKLLIDFKMYDNSGKGSPQTPVKPGFNMEEATRMLNDYSGGHSNFPVAQGIVDDFVKEYKDSHKDVKFSDRNQEAEVKYSAREFAEQVEGVKNNTHDRNNHVYMGTTPTGIVKVLDLPKLPMLVTSQHVYSMAVSKAQAQREGRYRPRYNYHGLGWDVVKKLPEYINKPVMIIKSNTDPKDAAFVVVTSQTDVEGNPIIAAIKPNGKGKYFDIEIPTNIMLSGYGKDGIQNYVARAKSENRILYARKENSQKNKANPSVQFADVLLSSDYSSNLAQFKVIVKNEFSGTIFENSGLPKFSDRDAESVSNRSLLANAFEGVAQNEAEKQKIREYRGKIETISAEEQKLRDLKQQIKELSFSKGPRDKKKLSALRDEATKTANRISVYDGQLLRLEASKPLQAVLEREKQKAYQKAREKGKEAQKAYREDAKKAEMRYKLRRTIRDLDKILKRGNKKLNVKEDMQGFASKALDLADYLFTDHISDDELIRRGITVPMRGNETQLVKETAEILSQLYDHADSLTDEEFTRLDEKRKRNMEKLRDLLKSQRNERMNTPVYNLFNDLVTEYANLKNSKQDAVKAAYNPDVERFLRTYIGDGADGTDSDRKTLLQNMRVADMTMDELWKLHNAYKMVLHVVRTANDMFVKSKAASIQVMADRIIRDFSSRKMPEGKAATVIRNLSNKMGWDYEKLYYALDRIGSEAFTELVMNIADSENTVMQDVMEAAAFRDEMAKMYGFNNWAVNKEIDREFLDNTGKKFKLTLGQLMALYAYSRREGTWDHIEYGGFVFGEAALTNPKPADSYKLSKAQCEAITGLLTKEQKGYVEAMQKFLSETMGEKGNEVSMLLYGIKMFGEKNYFPIHIAGQFKAQANESQAKAVAGFSSMSNAGFTHAQNPNAKAPFVLEGFNEIWADHVNEMSRYHGTVPALEDMRRVMNRSSYSESGAESMAIKQLMENSYGKEAVAYFDNLYREANSGAITDRLQKNSKKLLSLFRKNSVAYSLSVLIQQPASITRAYALVDKKYFGFKGFGAISSGIGKAVTDKWTKKHTDAYKEMLKYAPGVTMAKEIGGFDTATGGSIRSYLLDTNKSLTQKWKTGTAAEKGKAVLGVIDDNAIANLPNVADKIAWIEIWNACKRETVTRNKNLRPGSDAFMQTVGARFTEVIRATQVYDSIFSKSPMLKSKNLAVQYLVSFMNEPNTVANMAESAVRDFMSGDKKVGLRKAAVLIHGVIFTGVLKSIVYAMRDDDEDENYIEKYIEALTGCLMDDFNALNYIPLARDVWSLAQGYDVERADMAIVADALDALNSVIKNGFTDTGDMTEEQLIEFDKKCTQANWKLVESLAAFFGIPVKNIRRELVGVMNQARIAKSNMGPTTKKSAWDKFYDAVTDSIPFMQNQRSTQDKLYDAIMSGDEVYLARLKSGYKTDSAYQSALRKALRENDPRIKQAAEAKANGDLEEYLRLAREIIGEKYFSQDNVVAAINAEINALNKGESTPAAQKASGMFKSDDFAVAVSQNDMAMANVIMQDIIQTDQTNGKTQEEAQSSFASSAKTQMKELYLERSLTRNQAVSALKNYCGYEQGAAEKLVSEWEFEKKYGVAYDDRVDAYKSGTISKSVMQKILMDVAGKTEEEARLQIQVYDWQKAGFAIENGQTGIVKDYNDYCEPAGIDKKTYFDAYLFYEDSGEEGVAYSKTKECVVYINSLNLTPEQKTALALCWWAESTVQKYKLW